MAYSPATVIPTNIQIFQWARPDHPNPRLAAPIRSTDTTAKFTSMPKNYAGTNITGAFFMGVRRASDGLVTNFYVPAAAINATTLTATGLIRIRTNGLDYTTADDINAAIDHNADDQVFCAYAPVFEQMLYSVWTGALGLSASAIPYYASAPTFTPGSQQLCTIAYADALAIAGSPNASTTTKGIAEEATQAEIDAGTAAGGTAARLFVNPSTLATSIYSTQLPSSAQKSALTGTSGTAGSTNPYVTENDTGNGATITGTTIAFVNSNPDTITDSGNGFVTAGFRAGQTITVSGSASNNATFTVTAVAAGTLTLVSTDALVVEAAGSSVTITSATASKVARRKTTGDLWVPTTPTAGNDAASKTYVDSAAANKVGITVTPASVSGTALETTILSQSIPGGSLGSSNGIKFTISYTLTSISVTAKVLKLKYGSTTMVTLTTTPNAVDSTAVKGYITGFILADAATNAQKASMQVWGAVADFDTVTLGSGSMYAEDVGTASEDSTGALNLVVTAQMNSGDSMTMNHAIVERIR